jgi:beta-1,4-mannosyl-glycoprotein beta-1,4-N-acetylglucosaminyltransferase
MIVDCFTFFDELDVLELRLSLLDGVVDRFVLCEAPFTFRGTPKPLLFADHRERFARWSERIVHLVYDAPIDPNPWNNEWGQRAFLTTALADLADDDLVLIGDVDEIPAPHAAARAAPRPGVLAHRHRFSLGSFNAVVSETWLGTKAIARGDIGPRTLNDIRNLPFGTFDIIDSGWHFSSLGGPAVAASKIQAFSHAEHDIAYLTDTRRLAVQYEHGVGVRWVPLDASYPPLLHEPRWDRFVWPEPPAANVDAESLMHAHGCFASVPDGAACVGVLCDVAVTSTWERAGRDRFGHRFAGAFTRVDALLAVLTEPGWAVIDGLPRFGEVALAALGARGIPVVAYARNARMFVPVRDVLDGATFPPGPAYGGTENEELISRMPYRIERRDDEMYPIFNASVLEGAEPFEASVGPIRFAHTTRAAMHAFATYAFVFRLQPLVTFERATS